MSLKLILGLLALGPAAAPANQPPRSPVTESDPRVQIIVERWERRMDVCRAKMGGEENAVSRALADDPTLGPPDFLEDLCLAYTTGLVDASIAALERATREFRDARPNRR